MKELQKRFNIRLGFLKAGFDDDRYYWEIVLLFRKTIIVMMVTFLSPVSAGIQSLTAIAVLVIFYWLQLRFKPYYAESLNKMEEISLVVLLITIYSGLYYQSGKNDPIMQKQIVKWIIFIMVVLPSLFFTIYFFHRMKIEIFKVLITTNPRVFRYLTCGSVDINKFRLEHMPDDVIKIELEESEKEQDPRDIKDVIFSLNGPGDFNQTFKPSDLTDLTRNDRSKLTEDYGIKQDIIDPEDIQYKPK